MMQHLRTQQERTLDLLQRRARRSAWQHEVTDALGVALRAMRPIEGHAPRRLRSEGLIKVEICGWDEV